MQGGDLVRQRLEHCAAILKLCAAPKRPVTDAISYVLQHLAGAQLRATGERLVADLDTLDKVLGLLRADTDRASGAEHEQVPADQASDATQTLSENLGRAGRLVTECEHAHDDLGALTAALHDIVETFRRHAAALTEIVSSIVMVGLNARLHAYRLGTDGRVVAVVAGEIRTVVEQIASGSAPIQPMLERMVGAAAQVAQGSAAHATSLHGLGAKVGEAMQNLSQGRDRLQRIVHLSRQRPHRHPAHHHRCRDRLVIGPQACRASLGLRRQA